MRKFVPTIVVLGVVAGGFVVFARRLKELNDRLAEMERRVTAPAARVASGGPEIYVPATIPAETPVSSNPAVREERNTPRAIESTPVTPSTASTLAPDVQAAVAREVERILDQRMPFKSVSYNSKEPIEVMEEELTLTPAQKLRIAELLRQRDAELKEIGEKHPPQEVMKLFPEVQERYEQAILRELDVDQQKKYLELQKAGKLLGGGHVLFFSAGVGEKK